MSQNTADSARGREARSPSQIPMAGWKDIFWRVFAEISDDRVLLVAAGVTYYLLLAMVPALSAFVSIYGLFADPTTVANHMSTLQSFIPGGGMEIIGDQLTRLAEQGNATLGLTLVISLGIALWSANAGAKALFQAMNVAYDEEEKRSFVQLTLVSLAFTVAALTAAAVLIGVMVVLPVVLELFGFGEGAEWVIRIASYAGILVLVSLGIAALHRWGPSRDSAEWKWITPGAVLTVIVTAIVSVLFSWYVANFGSYNATYGSLGALIGFMTWIWITVTILIVGGELNSEVEHQTAHDTTVGPDQPLGQRGAVMADTIGRAADAGEDFESGPRSRRRRRARAHGQPAPMTAGALAVLLTAGLLLESKRRG